MKAISFRGGLTEQKANKAKKRAHMTIYMGLSLPLEVWAIQVIILKQLLKTDFTPFFQYLIPRKSKGIGWCKDASLFSVRKRTWVETVAFFECGQNKT